MKERKAGLHKTGSLWDQARKDVITESAKSGMLQHAIGGMAQQYHPMQAHMGGMQAMQVQYQAYGGKGATAMLRCNIQRYSKSKVFKSKVF